jgi:NitT/TauT family transport system permease protein
MTRNVLPGVIALAVLLGGWQIGVEVSHVSPIELVGPLSIFQELWRNPSLYLDSAWVTGQEAFWGFLVAFVVAIGAAIVIAHSKIMERALAPLVVMLQVTPIIALGPPLVIWLGFGPQPKIVLAALITFVPLLTNAAVGFRAIDPSTLEVMRSVDASRLDVFLRLRVPHSLPYLLAAIRVCVGLALIGAVVAEFFGSSAGLGYVMVSGQKSLDVYEVWASIFVLVFMGVLGVSLITLVGHRLLRWSEPSPGL